MIGESASFPAAPPSRISTKLDSPLIAAGFYFVLTIFMTWPLALRIGNWVPTGAVDLWQNYWNFWWWKTALFEQHQNPYRTPYLYFPTGTELVFYTHSIFNMLASMPVNLLFGPAASYNFCVVLALWLSGLGAYLLVKELTGDSRGAFLGGVVFAFFPQHMEQTLEHLNLFSVQFIPISLFFYFRLRRLCGRKVVWGDAVGLGLCFALNALTDWHLGIKLMLILVPLIVLDAIRRAEMIPFFMRDLAISGGIATLLTLPAVFPLLRGLLAGESFFQKAAEDKGIDPFYLFLPSFHHPLLGFLTRNLYVHRAYESAGFLCYLGFVPVGLAGLAVFRKQKGVWLWVTFFFVSLALAVGAHPYWHDRLHSNLTLPFAIFAKFPLLRLLRIANRFLIITSLALAVLVGFGWRVLKSKSDLQFGSLLALILIEYLWLPFPLQRIELPAFYQALARSTRHGAVFDIPFTVNGLTVRNMIAQTVHGKPIAGGYLSTVPPGPLEAITSDPALSDLMGLDPRLERPIDVRHLRELGFAVVIMHAEATNSYAAKKRADSDPKDLFQRKILGRAGGMKDEKYAAIRKELESQCGPPLYEDGEIVAFPIPEGR